jgi:mannose-6-phosphate isomerase-like protein (cupin superfamily)
MASWETTRVPTDVTHVAPDGSEIRVLPEMRGAGLAHCRLPAGRVTKPVRHQTIEEIWYVLGGRGDVWRREPDDGEGEAVAVEPGVALTVPTGVAFQFRAAPDSDLELLLVTTPPWPGPQEAVDADGRWEPMV